MLHRSLVKFIIDCLALSDGVVGMHAAPGECGLVTHLLDYAQYKISFEELYFQTLSFMSTFCKQYQNNDLRFVNWQKPAQQARNTGCLHLEEVDWCGNSPQWLSPGEYTTASQKGEGTKDQRFFSRKFRDPEAYNIADKQLGLDSTADMPDHVREGMDKDAKAVKKGGRVLANNNVAMYKEVQATSFQVQDTHQFQPSHLTDMDLTTRWSSEFSDAQHVNVSLVKDEGQWCNVTEVRIHWESAFATEYKIRVKEFDTGSWVTVVHDQRTRAKMGSQLMHVHTIGQSVDTSRIQAVQVEGLRRSSRWGYSIWELEVS